MKLVLEGREESRITDFLHHSQDLNLPRSMITRLAKGVLPPNWKKIGLTDAQVQDIYKAQSKYNDEIDKLELKIKELKASRDKDMKAVLTPDQKKRLDDILTGKDK